MNKIASLMLFLAVGTQAMAQEMPVVFNKSFSGAKNQYKKLAIADNNSIVAIGGGTDNGCITKLSSAGNLIYNAKLNKGGLVAYQDMLMLPKNELVAVGGGTIAYGNARITKLASTGEVIFDKSIGNGQGGFFTKVITDRHGNYITVGVDGSKPAQARITKMAPDGRIEFDKAFGAHNVFNNVLIDEDENIIAVGGDVGDGQGKAFMVKVDGKGEKLFELTFGKPGAVFEKMLLLEDGAVLAMGGGAYGTGNASRIAKVNTEGQVVFDKEYSTVDGKFNEIRVNDLGQIFACAEEKEKGRIVKLRPDGTELFNKETDAALYALEVGKNGKVVAAGGNSGTNTGKIVKLLPDGTEVINKNAGTSFSHLLLTEDDEIMVVTKEGYRLMKFNPDGEQMFDKQLGKYDAKTSLSALLMSPSGEIIAAGGGDEDGNRIIKVSHGVSINDIVVTEPLNGLSNASLTISLSGFLRSNGVRMPVNVHYKTVAHKGGAGVGDFDATEGTISFVPSEFAAGAQITKTIQIPVKSDNLLEGKETFHVEIMDASDLHLTKNKGEVTILDQPAIVKFIGGSNGAEPATDVVFSAGLFKRDGTPLINATSKPVRMTYKFGNGTAVPGSDFVNSIKAPFVIDSGSSTANLNVKVKDDNRFELAETVVLVLSEIKAENEAVVGYNGDVTSISATQYIQDQAAYITLVKLTDANESATAPVSMFKCILVKAADQSVQTNCTGSDINIFFGVDSASTAAYGKKYIIMNGDMVKITGDCAFSETDIQVALVNDRIKEPDALIVLKLRDVTAATNAGMLKVAPDMKLNKAVATIHDDDTDENGAVLTSK
ncbi:Calx-beta domain-containing protein [Chitinophaga dinghuensis]|uniref:Calx-beta domain-containing protein n=1 Tax=Chitinophaga dinghuensis TaxID=1539050 RepID=A0A327W2D0_9BACT|nr:Calx-beta domain-containing protein [Chitinophaga dinghuensis]RAJ83431.1 Calx-beta domain-containing protein [Chitinophaga dinghuensis]